MQTDPHGFNVTLTEKNKNNKNQIKPVIRLLKAWNANAGYPVDSYELEKEIVNGTYYFIDTLEEYFFSTINNISSYRTTATANLKIASLKDNAKRVKAALENNNESQALTWLSHILPMQL